MLIGAAPGALAWPAALAVWGSGYVSAAHKHHAVQLVFSLSGELQIRAGRSDPWLQCAGALVRADCVHEVQAVDLPTLIVFVDVESELAAPLYEHTAGQAIGPIANTSVARWRQMLGRLEPGDSDRVHAWLSDEFLARRQPPGLRPSVTQALDYLRQHLSTETDVSLSKLAAVVGLSPSRFMHAFTSSVGVPLRPYIRWLRLQQAASTIMQGASITEAAYAVGFADAAHLTRTFREMLGSTPSEVARHGAGADALAADG